MSLNSLINYISNSQITSDLINKLNKFHELNIIGSSKYAKSIIVNSIAKKNRKDIVIICPNTEIAYKWVGYFESINNTNIYYYPPIDHLPYSSINKSKEIEFTQLTVLSKLIKKQDEELKIVITTERALQPHLLNKNILIDKNINLFIGLTIEIKELTNKLTLLGYEKDNVTSKEATWSRRGEIIDIYPVNNELPIRIEFFDNTIEKIREYDPNSQKTLENTNNVEIIQSGYNLLIRDKLNKLSKVNVFESEDIKNNNLDRYLGIIEEKPSNLIDFINKNTIIVIDEIDDCRKFANNWYFDSGNNFDQCKNEIKNNLTKNNIATMLKPSLHIKFNETLNSLKSFNRINLYEFETKENIDNRFEIKDKIINSFSKNIGKLASQINKNLHNKDKVWILSAQPLRTRTLLFEHECNTHYLEKPEDINESKKLIQS